MNRFITTTDKPDPWSVPLVVEQIPDTGLHRDLTANEAARQGIAELGGLRDVSSASASLDVTPKSGGRFHVSGRVRGRVGQICVVSLDPMETDIDEEIDLIFAPPDQIPQLSDLVDDAAESEVEIPDPPEPIENGVIDLGRLATDALLLAINPHPRKPDAVFDLPIEKLNPEDHPFAALKALQAKPKTKLKPNSKPKSE